MIIYKVTNLTNNKIYIGQTINSLKSRISQHYGDSKRHNYRFCNALNKYNKNDFVWEIIEKCNSIEELNEREQFWIKYYDSTNKNIGYNLTTGGLSYTRNKETLLKMSKSLKGRPSSFLGHHHTQEVKNRLSIIQKNVPLSKEHKLKISINLKGKTVKNIIGKKFSRLTVIKDTGKRYLRKNRTNGEVIWLCKCDCGNETEVVSCNLTRENTKSCGCLLKKHQFKKNHLYQSKEIKQPT